MTKGQKQKDYQYDAIMRYARLLGFGEIHTKIDKKTGLHAIVAINNTQLGPAIGGTRCIVYPSTNLALIDALRLSYQMTLKSAISDLPHGGAKAVLAKPKIISDRAAYFRSYGDFVHSLDGRYIAAVDVGTDEADMDIIAERTPYVVGASGAHKEETDPSPYTARGVLRGIEAAVKFKLNRASLEGVHVAIQGAGHVGYDLTELLTNKGAKVSITDTKADVVRECAEKFGAIPVDIAKIYDVPCDVFAPCALGGVLNLQTISRLQAKIVAGSANNQLAHSHYGTLMHKKGILYAPDFVINSGGLICAAMMYDYRDVNKANAKINQLYDTLLQMFDRSLQENKPTQYVAEMMARERLRRGPNENDRSF